MEHGEMRAGDDDRQTVADQLRVALDEGRLSLHEYDDRLQRAYAATTYADLGHLVADLPAARVPAPRTAPTEPVPRTAGAVAGGTAAAGGAETQIPALVQASDRVLAVRWLGELWGTWLWVNGFMGLFWVLPALASGEFRYFWPFWVAGPWGVVLVWVSVAGLLSGEPRKQAEKQAAKRARKKTKKERKRLEAKGSRQVTSGTPDADERRSDAADEKNVR